MLSFANISCPSVAARKAAKKERRLARGESSDEPSLAQGQANGASVDLGSAEDNRPSRQRQLAELSEWMIHNRNAHRGPQKLESNAEEEHPRKQEPLKEEDSFLAALGIREDQLIKRELPQALQSPAKRNPPPAQFRHDMTVREFKQEMARRDMARLGKPEEAADPSRRSVPQAEYMLPQLRQGPKELFWQWPMAPPNSARDENRLKKQDAPPQSLADLPAPSNGPLLRPSVCPLNHTSMFGTLQPFEEAI